MKKEQLKPFVSSILVLHGLAMGAFGAPRSPEVCQQVASSKDYAGIWEVKAEGAGGWAVEPGKPRCHFVFGKDGTGVMCDRGSLGALRWRALDDGRLAVEAWTNKRFEFAYHPDSDTLAVGGENAPEGAGLTYVGSSLPAKDAQGIGADIWNLGNGSPAEQCACYGADERQMQSVDEVPDLAAMLDAGNGFYIRPEGGPAVDLRPHAIATNLLDGAVLANEGGKGWSSERTETVFGELQSLGVACDLLKNGGRTGIHFTAERSQLKDVEGKLRMWLADLPYPCRCIDGETPSGWVVQDDSWQYRHRQMKADRERRRQAAEEARKRFAENGRTVESCTRMMKAKDYEGVWSDGLQYTLTLRKKGEGLFQLGAWKMPLRWTANRSGALDVVLYCERDTKERTKVEYLPDSDTMVILYGKDANNDPRRNYMPFKTAEVPDEKEDEGQAPDFRNPISRSKCEELMKAGKYGIRRAESWDELPSFKALMENDEGWCFVDDEYPRIRVNRCQLVEDWFQFWIEVGRYSPLLRAAPISDNCRSRNSSDDDPDTDRGWKRKRQKAFHKGLEAMKIYYSTSSYDYSGRFTYTREDDISLTTDLQEIPLLMEYLKKELADMKFPRYYRVQKVEFVGKRPGDAPQK